MSEAAWQPWSTAHFVYFATGAYALTREDQDQIRDVAGMMQSTPAFVATIIGKTDSVGSAEFNEHLSQRRAEAVFEALVYTHKVPENRVRLHWTGKRLPYISAADEQAAADPIIRLLRELAIFQRKSDTYRHEMVRVLLEFADHHGANPMIRSFGTLIQKFDALYGKYQEVVPRRNVGKQSEGPGDPISLTSKALWCCFPRIVPLYDRYSQNAIFIISRLDQHSPEDGVINNRISHRYTAFADLWLQIYEQAKPVIDNADLRGYRYKVRVFDRILWFIGREDYIRDPGELPPVRTSALQRRT